MTFSRLAASALDWIYPPACAVCNQPLRGGKNLCPACILKLPPLPENACRTCAQWFDADIPAPDSCANCQEPRPAFDFATAALRADETTIDLIHQFKLIGRPELGPDLGRICSDAFHTDDRLKSLTAPLLIPVSLHPSRLRQRRFNQAHAIAQPLAAKLELELLPALKRVRATDRQATLTRNQRLANLHQAFALRVKPEVLRNRNLILIDDVLTTGSTAHACARILKKARPATIAILTVVRA